MPSDEPISAPDPDVIGLDLEDAVGANGKADARRHARAWLDSGGRAPARINGGGTTWFDDDVRAGSARPPGT